MSENRTRFRLDQRRAPIYEALEQFRQMRVVPFDVPGHKRGRGNPELTAFLGQQCVGVDVNSMKPLDNLCHPVSVIREAEELAADAFGAAHAFLMVGGTTSSVQSMVLTACKRGDEIILPRNVHRSVLNALVLCGAVPVYVNPEVDKRLGISLGMKREQVAKAIKEHPNAVAVLVNNPTYYGICSDLRAIVKMAHEAGMLCLADEAHGTHFYFGNGLPVSAMAAGADMASVSMHKSGGSLTQSSLLKTMGKVGVALAMIGVVICPITSGDTAFRSARLTLSDWLKIDQDSYANRLKLCVPVLGVGAFLGIGNALGFIDYTVIWRYFSWTNQTLAMIVLWAASMYLFKEKKNFWITAVPATFMSAVSCTYFVLAPECLGKMINTYADGKLVAYNTAVAYPIGIVFAIAMLALFIYATKKNTEKKAA